MQFTDPSPAIYWYAKNVKLTFLNIPVLHQSNKNNVPVFVSETQCIIYLHSSQASRKKLIKQLMIETKLFFKGKTKNTLKHG